MAGPARKVFEDRLYKHHPPFLQLQMNYNVPEKEVIDPPPFVEGDRVQLTTGPEKGKIGTVHSVYKDGNCVFVEGLGGTTSVVIPRSMWLQGQNKPYANIPNPIKYDKLRLVSQVKNEDGTVEDVAIHSVSFSGTTYDKERNKIMPVRRAKHDPSIIIPYPLPPDPVKPSDEKYATAPDVVRERTFYPPSLAQGPIPTGALDQIRNPHSKWHKDRDARKISEREARKFNPPEMPQNPATRELLRKLAQLPKPEPTKFTKEIEDYISTEIEKGLNKRAKEEAEAIKMYK